MKAAVPDNLWTLRTTGALLAAGKRRSGLQESLETRVLPLFAGPFKAAGAAVIDPWQL